VYCPLVTDHLGAEQASGNRVVGVTGHTQGTSVFDLDEQATGIGTVIRADGAEGFNVHGRIPFKAKVLTLYPKPKNNCR
jgi:hypothetical protein